MISLENYYQIKDLNAQGLSNRAIAKRVGVTPPTVKRVIGMAEHPDERVKEPPPPFPRAGENRIRYVRCQECGAMVQFPCFACYLRGKTGAVATK